MKRHLNHVGLMLLGVGLGPLAAARADTYSFQLFPPNTTEDPSTGETMTVTGGGIFDTDAGTVLAMGSYAIRDGSGVVVERGRWAATDFARFVSFGGTSPGNQGGFLEIAVTLFPRGGVPVTNVPMTVMCHLGDIPDEFHHVVEGTTVGDFTQKTGGLTLFNLHEGL